MAVFEFDDFAAVDADEVVVIGVVNEVGVVGGLSVAEVNFVNEVGFGKEGEGSVDGGPGGFGAGGAKTVEELVGGEVFVGGKDDFEDFITLGSLAEAFFADELVESLSDFGVHSLEMLRDFG